MALAGVTVAWGLWLRPHYNGDFSAYWAAGRSAWQGIDPYRGSPVMSDGRLHPHSPFFYPPSSIPLFAPLALLPYHVAKNVWLVLEVAMLVAALRFAGLSWLTAVAGATVLLTVAPLAFNPLYAHLERGQADLLTLFGIALAWHAWHRDRSLVAGAALAAAGLVKPPVLLLLTVPLLERQWRLLAGAAGGAAVLGALSLPLVGLGHHRQYWLNDLPSLARGVQPFYSSARAQGQAMADVEGHSYPEHARFSASMGTAHMVYQKIVSWTAPRNREAAKPYHEAARGFRRWLPAVGAGTTVAILYLFGRRRRDLELRRWRWITAMVAALIWHPMTWIMQYVWLVFAGALLWSGRAGLLRPSVGAVVVGLALSCIAVGEPVISGMQQALFGEARPRWYTDLLAYRVAWGGFLLWLVCVIHGPGRKPQAEEPPPTTPD